MIIIHWNILRTLYLSTFHEFILSKWKIQVKLCPVLMHKTRRTVKPWARWALSYCLCFDFNWHVWWASSVKICPSYTLHAVCCLNEFLPAHPPGRSARDRRLLLWWVAIICMHILVAVVLFYYFDLDYYGNMKNNLVWYLLTILCPACEAVHQKWIRLKTLSCWQRVIFDIKENFWNVQHLWNHIYLTVRQSLSAEQHNLILFLTSAWMSKTCSVVNKVKSFVMLEQQSSQRKSSAITIRTESLSGLACP